MEIRIQAIKFDADEKLIDFTKKKISKLSTFHDKIIDVDVFFKFTAESSIVKEKAVEIKVNIPGSTLFVEERSISFEAALDVAIEVMKRRLKRTKEKEQV